MQTITAGSPICTAKKSARVFTVTPFLLFLLAVFSASFSMAENYEYEVGVDGMVCAYCAYNVSKRFQAVPGVAAHSVVVDLKGNRVNFQTSTPLAEPLIKSTLADSGFSVVSIDRTSIAQLQAPPPRGTEIARVTFPVSALGSEMSTALLDTLGETAEQQQGHFTVKAPGDNETDLLKPLIGGRQQVIDVDYNTQTSDEISVILWTP